MAKTMEVCNAFANGQSLNALNAHSVGDRIYSYNTVIGYRENGKVYVNTSKYSCTTSRHQTYLRRALVGVEVVEYTPKNRWLGI